MLGSQMLLPIITFAADNRVNTFSGDNGGNAGYLVPGLAIYDVISCTPKLKLGISLTSPYGGLLNYNDGWVGRYYVQNLELLTLNLNPALAYKIGDHFSVGAGVSLEYGNLHQTNGIPLPRVTDGQINVKVHSEAPGFNAGILFTPNELSNIGIAYRSQITHHFHGIANFLRINTEPSVSTELIMPQNIISSIKFHVNPKLSVLGEAGWSNWSTLNNPTVTIDGFSLVSHIAWHDTFRVGLGWQYQLSPLMLWQAGVSYDSSPTNSRNRLPDLPMDRQIRAGTGLILSIYKIVQLAFSYEFIDFGKAPIESITRIGTLAGYYNRNYANVLQVSVNLAL
jgi:long-chain fatty acid transport protein